MLSGLHAPNGTITQADLDVMRAGHFQAVKLMAMPGSCEHTPADIALIRTVLPNARFYVRLPDSRNKDGTFPDAYSWADRAAAIARPFIAVGVQDFQICNELQYEWKLIGYGPFECAFWLRLAVERLRSLLPPVSLISPPLSWSPALWKHGPQNPTPYTLDEWLAAYSFDAGGTEPTLWRVFDKVGANCYWQSERQMHDPSFGASFSVVHARSGGTPVAILEYGNSMRDKQPRPPQVEIEAAMASQYPRYLAWLRSLAPVVDSAFAFISPGALGWEGFTVTEAVASAMAA